MKFLILFFSFIIYITPISLRCQIEIDDSSKASYYKYSPIIEELNKKYLLLPLTEKGCYINDFEIRVWQLSQNLCLATIIDSTSEGMKIYYIDDSFNIFKYFLKPLGFFRPQKEEIPDQSICSIVWEKLLENDILSLPDEIENYSIDGILYLVEIKSKDTYRCYGYLNPEFFNTPDTKKITNIIEIINKEIFARN